MALQGWPRRGRQVTTGVFTTGALIERKNLIRYPTIPMTLLSKTWRKACLIAMLTDGLRIETRAPMTANMDWSDFSKLVEATMRVERCLADEEKNKRLKSSHYGPSTSSAQGKERCSENRRFALCVHH
ncbi:hypothetical protein E6C27_scaffold294G00360 [Cucumis melo var. makuwa]|uniref:Uncharacterized protein n=1 Tax=Cucumis melo var. makuwa TaxID=1194695 RepID=A0A5A7TUD1_CUCMM|nr:hypothetical protein E6C27_scaffold294G00360 [Cucumis melo var. makuwa]